MATSASEATLVSVGTAPGISQVSVENDFSSDSVPEVSIITDYFHSLLAVARKVKPENSVLPLLPADQFQDAFSITNINSTSSPGSDDLMDEGEIARDEDTDTTSQLSPKAKDLLHSNISLAVRRVFYHIICSSETASPEFVDMWNLLDIVLFAGNAEQCDPGLMTALVEELLDSNSIDGCRLVFDYLESRREPLIFKHFEARQTRNLITLRSCSELLRRLSRADEAVFCGRVFIFLFQSFPLGEKGWVNYKGDFNTENVTTYRLPASLPDSTVNGNSDVDTTMVDSTDGPAHPGESMDIDKPATLSNPREGSATISKDKSEKLDINDEDALKELYPMFWSMQEVFSNPLQSSDPNIFDQFKKGLVSTLKWFKSIRNLTSGANQRNQDLFEGQSLNTDESSKSGFPDVINPKYLTSFELFKLELSDLSFQRNILVQALILIDFLLSLTPETKQRVAHLPNKSIQYSYTLSEPDTKWAIDTRASIAGYLQSGLEGKFYYRMVDSVLSLDRNWVYWKMDNCPPIARDSVAPETWNSARQNLVKRAAPRPMRPNPPGSIDFGFLEDGGVTLDMLEAPIGGILSVSELIDKAEMADLDLAFAMGDRETQDLQDKKATATWCAFRSTISTNFPLMAQVGNGMDVEKLREVLAPRKKIDSEGDYDGEMESGEAPPAETSQNDGNTVTVEHPSASTAQEVNGAVEQAREAEPVDITMLG